MKITTALFAGVPLANVAADDPDTHLMDHTTHDGRPVHITRVWAAAATPTAARWDGIRPDYRPGVDLSPQVMNHGNADLIPAAALPPDVLAAIRDAVGDDWGQA